MVSGEGKSHIQRISKGLNRAQWVQLGHIGDRQGTVGAVRAQWGSQVTVGQTGHSGGSKGTVRTARAQRGQPGHSGTSHIFQLKQRRIRKYSHLSIETRKYLEVRVHAFHTSFN